MTEPHNSLIDNLDHAVTAIGRAVRRELWRTALDLLTGIAAAVLVMVIALGFVVAGIMRLGDALGHACGTWFGNQVLGDAVVGATLLLVPVLGIVMARWWMKKR